MPGWVWLNERRACVCRGARGRPGVGLRRANFRGRYSSSRAADINPNAEVRVEYASLCHPETLEEVEQISGPTLLAIAVWVGEVRLIDNCVLY